MHARRFHVTLAITVVAAGLSVASFLPVAHRLHQSCPVSKSHVMFANDCAKCHDQAFQPVARLFGCKECVSTSDQACQACHRAAPHHGNEPACASCHREHRGHETLAVHVADRNCAACHGRDYAHPMDEKRPIPVTNFNHDHAEFSASLPNAKDPSKIKFNHKAHLDLDLDALRRALEKAGRTELKDLGAKMQCADCHRMDDERKYFRPIQYENHCARCHALNAPLVGEFAVELRPAVVAFGKTPLPHREPVIVRAAMRDRLLEFAQANKIVPGKGAPSVPRPLPWQPQSDAAGRWEVGQASPADAVSFMNRQWSKTETLPTCGHCHIEKDRKDGLPVFLKTAIPQRWHPHSVFSHGSHRTVQCGDCHDRNSAKVKVAASVTASDILMPTLQVCQECHRGPSGARNACVECHRYHAR
jgi:hypothetical protein